MQDTRARDSLKGLYRFCNTCAAKGHDISGGSVTKCEAVILGRIAACFCHPGRGNALFGHPAKSTFNWKTALDVLLAGGTMGSSVEARC